jgi:hypothetical protein
MVRRKITRPGNGTNGIARGSASDESSNGKVDSDGRNPGDPGTTDPPTDTGTATDPGPDSSSGSDYTVPGNIGATASVDAPRKRGRPRGSTTVNRKATQATAANLEALLYSLHLMGASFLKMPEFAITEAEAKNLADATERVTALYDLSLLSEKTVAWIHLTIIAAGTYGPRYVAVSTRKKEAKIPVAPAPVSPFPTGSGFNPVTIVPQ